MRLKKLELYGFKSFADRTVFEFEDSLSALVGPNGSGKSNIVDAIKWVLGERSAQKIRGAEMANVIFNGSKSRKPLNYAEVKLTIDNSDGRLPVEYEEVCIRRRFDRGGQSEFHVNDQPCRLKDIRSLLLDTGVGTSCYSVIEQGQIDRILRSNPKERRQVFEEAAGINRFLEQKREAERKLERVSSNLARVNDIVEEVHRQLRSVKYQAGRARTFRKLSERLQQLHLAYGLHSHRTLSAERDRHSQTIEATRSEKARLAEEAETCETGLEGARRDLQNAQNELAESRQRLTRIVARIEGLGRETELGRRRQEELQHRLDELDLRHNDLLERLRGLAGESEEAAAKLERSSEELEERTAKLQAARDQMESTQGQIRNTENAAETRKTRIFDLFQRESQLRNQVQVLATEKRTLHNRLERVKNRQQNLDEHLSEAQHERSKTHGQLQALQAQRAGLKAAMERCRHVIAEAEARLARISANQANTLAELSSKRARRDVLADLEARSEGVGSGVRALLDSGLPGMVGLVAEVLRVPVELARAVEAALGEKVQAVIFETAAQAQQALRLLAQGEHGRADLLVLDRLPARPLPSAPSVGGLRGRLSELVGHDERSALAVQFLLGNAFLVDDAQSPADLPAGSLADNVRFVTPSGECYGGNGVWSAGTPEVPSLISRRSELAELELQISGLERKLAGLAKTKQSRVEDLERHEAERERLTARTEELGRSAGDVQSQLQVASSRASELREEIHLTRSEETAIGQDMESLGQRASQLEGRCDQASQDRADAQKAVEAEQARLRALQHQHQTLAEEVNSLGSELARAREQQRNLQVHTERLLAERQRTESETASLAAQREATVRRQQEAQDATNSAQADCRALEAERADLSEKLTGESATLKQFRDRIDALARRSKEIARQREEIEERLHSLRMAENETAIKMQDLVERTAENDGVHLLALAQEPECWNENSPFTAKAIREFTDNIPEPAPVEPVAAWYKELEGGPEAPQADEDEGPELITLEKTIELRSAMLEMTDDPATDWDSTRAEIAKLKAKVDRVGNVNVGAIRQQEELEIRAQFLSDQREDLETARRHEREIIRELNKKSREKFRETFEQVRVNFQGIFRKLFGGGAADLVLDDEEEDILEAGIEVVARPPGKETSSLTLLSGGERALTTIALLFAMFQAKPSPFCLLDEVDAPLDDANIERFLMLLEEFRQGTQFIVVTHNKLTMSVAQVLYGLTMADGVSKKISVKFEEVSRKLSGQTAPRAKAG